MYKNLAYKYCKNHIRLQLIELLEQFDLKQVDLARLLDINYKTPHNWFNGMCVPRRKTLELLCYELKLNMDDFLIPCSCNKEAK